MNQVAPASGGDQGRAPWSRGAQLFVWMVWAGMLAIVLWHFFHYARNLPLAEDWNLVAPLTGHEPDLGGWLWSQNNEHRLPLPRLVMLALLKVTGGDFRSGMVFNITVIALLAAAMIEVARRLRGGRTRYTDAFFPILLLEVGDWQNLFWTWQLSFVLSVVIGCVALLAIVRRPGLETPGAAAAVGVSLVLAPLTGGTGLLFLPPLLLWAGWRGIQLVRAGQSRSERRAATILLGAVGLTAAVIAVYMVGYERPSWIPPNPGLRKSLMTALQFQAFGLGPAVRTSWTFWSTAALLLLVAATLRTLLTVRRFVRSSPDASAGGDRFRGLGLLTCLASVAVIAAGMGWGRAAVIDVYSGWPDRYVLLAAPAFCMAYFAWELPGSEKLSMLARGVLFALAALLLPLNTAFGREYGHWYVRGMDRVMGDIRTGIPRDVLAGQHLGFLVHWWDPPRLAEHMQMLHDRGIGPFAAMISTEDSTLPPSLDSLTLRYQMPDAGAVRLIWGIDNWRRVPAPIRPPGTTLTGNDNAMSTPMRREGNAFTVTLRIPRGASLEYGFLIMARNDQDSLVAIWDGNRRREAGSTGGGAVLDDEPGVTLLTNPLRGGDTVLVKETLRYGPTDARRVRLVWGIAGWQRLPNELFPPGTSITNLMMTTTMQRRGSIFTATVPVPAGRPLDFAFQLDRGDQANVSDNNRGRNYGFIALRDSTVTTEPSLSLVSGSRFFTVLWTGAPALLILAVLAGLSARIGRRSSPVIG